MNEVTSAQVQRVRGYSRFARRLCSVLLVLLAISVAVVIYAVLHSPGSANVKFLVGNYTVAANHVDSLALKAWLLLVMLIGLSIAAALLALLRSLFANLAQGEIFSGPNALLIRRLAQVILVIGVLQIIVPICNDVLSANGVFAPGRVSVDSGIRLPGLFTPFAVAGLVFLVSWIMRVGLGVSNEADDLRREAELVV